MGNANTLILGTHKGLIILEKNGRDWHCKHEAHRAIPVSHAMTDPRTGVMWACLDHGHYGRKLHRSDDGGETWREIPAPKYPENTEREPGVPATCSYLWLIQPGGNDQPNRLYIGTEPGGLFQSDDGGETWELNEALWNHPSREKWWFGGGRDFAGLCSIVVDPRDSNHVTIGISVGGVYETRDGGKTWDGRNTGLKASYLPNPASEFGHDPHFMLASPSNPDVLWQQNHCGVFRSTDAGKTWTDISQRGGPVYFGFAIAVDAEDENVAWVVPATSDEYRVAVNQALCVARTNDGGKTWVDFREGLPQQGVYDVAYRHALDVRGDRLAFGTTTGNVFLSEDRGESWRSLGNHFPPVLSVRFA